MSEHTPGPWRIGDAGLTVFGPPNGNPSPETVAPCKTRANAAFIVKACNGYEDLLEACKFLQPLAIKHAPQGISKEYWDTAFDKLEKAIHKAEEE